MIKTILFDMGGTLEDIWYNDQTIHSVTGELRTFLNEHDLGTGCNDITFWNKLNSGIRTYKQWSESNELEKKPEEIWPEYYMAGVDAAYQPDHIIRELPELVDYLEERNRAERLTMQ